jgi:hypothetical protein
MDDETNQFQEVNITSLWNKNLLESLLKLQDFERIIRDGSTSITEYLQISQDRVPEIQFQHLRMMISEMGILLSNIKRRINKAFFLKAKVQLKQMKKVIDLDPQDIFIPLLNQQNHTTNYYLSETFYNYLAVLTQMREEIVSELADILFGKPMEKMGGMDKSVSLLR